MNWERQAKSDDWLFRHRRRCMLVSFRQWFRRRFRYSVLPQRPLRFRPQLEQLETRVVPAVYRVTTLADSDIGAAFSAAGTGSAANPFHGANLTIRMAL